MPPIAHRLPLIALRDIFVPPRVLQKCHANTLTNLISVARASVGFLTPAIAVEDPIQAQIVQTLENNFRPLPELPSTPIVFCNLRKELIDYPDKIFAEQLLFSLKHGFDIGYSEPQVCNLTRNLKSAASHTDHIRACLIKEWQHTSSILAFIWVYI